MSPVTEKISMICLVIAAILAASACGRSNSDASFDTHAKATGEAVHPSDWLPAGHEGPAEGDVNSCKGCHGEDLLGGISKVSCTSCHLGGPLAVHPAVGDGFPWFQASSSNQGHGVYVVQNGTAACKNMWCHGPDLQGVAQSGPACSTCHPGEAF